MALEITTAPTLEFGRRIVLAIDRDDFQVLLAAFSKYHEGTSQDIDSTVNHEGYFGYKWTPWIAQFLGDTILHLALKEKKHLCVNALLLMGASTNITNYFKETTNELCLCSVGRNINYVKSNASLNLLPFIKIGDAKRYPRYFPFLNLQKEALHMLHNGRVFNSCLNFDEEIIDAENLPWNGRDDLLNILYLQKKGCGDTATTVKKLSTKSNLKYMQWREADIESLAVVLHEDSIINTLIFSSVQLSSAKLMLLLPAVLTMQSLQYLDLSNNCINDEGATAFAIAYETCSYKECHRAAGLKVILTGNRITAEGAIELVRALMNSCSLLW